MEFLLGVAAFALAAFVSPIAEYVEDCRASKRSIDRRDFTIEIDVAPDGKVGAVRAQPETAIAHRLVQGLREMEFPSALARRLAIGVHRSAEEVVEGAALHFR